MSPAAIGGPHLRATSINSTGPINTTRRNWINGVDNSKGESRVLPHLSDLVNAKPLVDRQSSLRKLLEAGEEAAKQAETLLDFKRLDLALQQYIVAFTIAVEYIPQSPHYPDLRTRPDYPRLYAGLQNRLNIQHSRFEEVKRLIKEDNARTGISPSNSFTHNGQPVPRNIDNSAFEPTMRDVYSNAADRQLDTIDITKSSESRPKPTVQPKPQGLHGKSIQMANRISPTLSISSENDLATRFARLRSSNNPAPIQDPRIRTQQITIPDGITVDRKSTNAVSLPKQNASILRPLGPREMPTSLAIPLTTEKPILAELLNNLQYFGTIIYDHAYDRPLKRRPMLLAGGVDSWVDLVGSGALQGAIHGNKSLPKTKKHDHHALGRVSIAREPRKTIVTKRTISRSRTLSATEEEKWDKALKECVETDDAPAQELAIDESRYARTTEEFMRRYPEISTVKQSMALPSKPRSLPLYDGSMISAPPTRPPPALPRQRSSGISEKTPYKNYAMTGGNSSAPPRVEPGLCGLRNVTGSLCYMNTAIQILSASPAIRNLFIRFQYPCNPAIPKKQHEDSPPRQLMTRALRSLLQHMWCGKYDEIVPRMFQQYVHATAVAYKGNLGANPKLYASDNAEVHTPVTTYGSATQHDCGEFLGFLSDRIMDEQNINRDKSVKDVDFGATNIGVDFPEILDMGKYTWLSEKDDYSDQLPAEQKRPFLYDCYAVVQHSGTPKSGHYWALAHRYASIPPPR
ncbi:hypothetical protein SS1G_02262 [Sclerotinia sclerotiorum 1980 UF-70]|uniref:USP domain-containing protein n=1 Tax=Sclerotinia sclerotiorum (strain ATCC 18683 / 1980 / Ss-1) TaxID=665079 RepID=A7EAD0_SCLS1|nr:hypothetical protein SS1G_02262 [Sclerotinia sclerotiorum 1980 UF-70]EDN99408.1 hypothetical protein SS1G_02262 [Sclerotinia sclerotiorum 1980 UF-70]